MNTSQDQDGTHPLVGHDLFGKQANVPFEYETNGNAQHNAAEYFYASSNAREHHQVFVTFLIQDVDTEWVPPCVVGQIAQQRREGHKSHEGVYGSRFREVKTNADLAALNVVRLRKTVREILEALSQYVSNLGQQRIITLG